jgi:hypothetical protein
MQVTRAALALTDLMSAQVRLMFDNLPSSIDHIVSCDKSLIGSRTSRRRACYAPPQREHKSRERRRKP